MSHRQIIVTGASSGIGKAVSGRLLDDGHSVVGVSRRPDTGTGDGNGAYRHEAVDLSDLAALESRIPELIDRAGSVSGLILSAGYGEFGNLEEFSYEQLQRLIDVNLTAQIFLSRAFLPIMKRNGFGDLVFIGSESALSGGRRGAAYVAAKSGMLGLARALRQECASSGVRVGIVNLGMTKSSFYDSATFTHGHEPDNYIEPEDVAAMVSAMLNLRSGTVVDEIRMTPAKSVIQRRTR